MSEELFYKTLGVLLSIFGTLLLLLKILNPLQQGESESGKAAYYQIIILSIGLIVCGLIIVLKN